jgi:hypothetical protein
MVRGSLMAMCALLAIAGQFHASVVMTNMPLRSAHSVITPDVEPLP